jgi:hypothetical protein
MARQGVLSRVSGELQRKIGLKVIALGGNAVVGYREDFDFEGESGMIVRGIGTAVLLQVSHHSIERPMYGLVCPIASFVIVCSTQLQSPSSLAFPHPMVRVSSIVASAF